MWQISPGQSLEHRGWADEFVIFNDLSGDTHLLGPDAMAILLCLRDGPRDENGLANALDANSAGQREALAVLLAELSGLALLEAI